ncbi:MAG: cytochrome d ubiquinol oxidase subunit II [Bacteroidetes bacterium]|nr:cytochrome d ubiquinol oxidase subunit II [Bacteroidota bacterium]
METIWFINVTFMFGMYIVLDGFDLGAGILHLFLARSDAERRTILRTIGPFWDGNEVWLLAAGGTLYFAFPLVYASLFSGFYIPLMLVLWLLMFRALGIELRHQSTKQAWIAFWDTAFCIASLLITFLLGVAFGNILRGLPLTENGYFQIPLISSFSVHSNVGILDWFTILCGLFSVAALTSHGAQYIAVKTVNSLRQRATTVARKSWYITIVLLVAILITLLLMNNQFFSNFLRYPFGLVLPVLILGTFVAIRVFNQKDQLRPAFVSSSLFLFFTFLTFAFCLYPTLLPSLSTSNPSITIYTAAAEPYGLSVGLAWWIFGIILVIGYFVYVYRAFRGPVIPSEHEGY